MRISEAPAGLKPFLFHGVDVELKEGSKQANGTCPFCGKEGKFFINVENTKWDCKVCGAYGNNVSFLKKLWQDCEVKEEKLLEFAAQRSLVDSQTLTDWGVVQSLLTDEWLVPGYSPNGSLAQLYRYVMETNGKRRLYATPEFKHQLHGTNLYDGAKPEVYLCEGPWDGMALYEVLWMTKYKEGGGLTLTTSKDVAVGNTANVLAVPGCGVFYEQWSSLFADKIVYLCYDNDHPGKNTKTGAEVEPGSLTAMKRVARILVNSSEPPKEIKYLCWGPKGYDPKLTSGYDIRDWLSKQQFVEQDGIKVKIDARPADRVTQWAKLQSRFQPIPLEWIPGGKQKGSSVVEVGVLPCGSWRELISAWRKAFKWSEGLETGLAVMLSSIISTEVSGDQLWVKIVGPPSCGKSTLCEAVSLARDFVVAKSTIRGFHSGYKNDRDGEEDSSLIATLKNKTLITKDGDTLLTSPNLGQVLSEARDIYDRVSRTHYRNGMDKDYEGINMTWILCGTASLRSLDDSELGQRFLDCVVVEELSEEDEKSQNMRKLNQLLDGLRNKGEGTGRDGETAELLKAKQLTGGYVNYLRKNVLGMLSDLDTSDDNVLETINNMGTFVAFMRARPSSKQEEEVSREISTRLVSQICRLAACMAVVLGSKTLNQTVINRVRKVAIDTSRGRTLNIAKHLYAYGEEGLEIKALSLFTSETEDKLRSLLRFLTKIKAVEVYTHQITTGLKSRPKWRLTDRMYKLYKNVVDIPKKEDKA